MGALTQDLESFELVMLFNRIASQIHKTMDLKLKPYGLARTQYLVLAYLLEPGYLSTGELVTKLMVEPATLSGIVDVLERKGFVVRESHISDKRRKDIRLTEAGMRLIEGIPVPRGTIEAVLRRDIDPVAVQAVLETGEQMLRNLEDAFETKEEVKLA